MAGSGLIWWAKAVRSPLTAANPHAVVAGTEHPHLGRVRHRRRHDDRRELVVLGEAQAELEEGEQLARQLGEVIGQDRWQTNGVGRGR